MDFLNQALTQLGASFRAMTPAGRIAVGALLTVVLISVAYLVNHPFTAGDGYLFGGDAVSPSQLPAIEAAFGKKNLTDYELQGNRIRVPQGKQSVYMAALADAGALPHNFLDSLKTSLESGGPFVDRHKREEIVKVALQDELAKIIGQMNGIERATVLYNVETPQNFNSKKIITASVTVKPLGSQTLNADQVQMVRQAVGPAIGADPESVAVVDINGRAYPAAGSNSDNGQDRYLTTKHQFEREYTDSIRQVLSFVKGAVVTVNVELHPEFEESESTDQINPKTSMTGVADDRKDPSVGVALPGGLLTIPNQVGVPNSPLTVVESHGDPRLQSGPLISSDRELLCRQSRQVRKAGLTPKRVTVSIGVPSGYYQDVWQQRNAALPHAFLNRPDPTVLAQIQSEVNDNIKKSVLGIIPLYEVAGADSVTVTSFTSVPAAEIETPTATDRALVWMTDHGNALATGLLFIVGLLIVRSILRNLIAATKRVNPPAVSATLNDRLSDRTQQSATAAVRRRHARSVSPRDELVDLVRDDPDGAANVLRHWIGSTN